MDSWAATSGGQISDVHGLGALVNVASIRFDSVLAKGLAPCGEFEKSSCIEGVGIKHTAVPSVAPPSY